MAELKRLSRLGEFYWECLRRAFSGKLLHIEGIAGLLGIIVQPMWLYFNPTDHVLVNWLPAILFGAVFIGTVTIGLIIAPRDLYQEAMAEIGSLNLTIEDKERIQKALNELWRLRREGVQIRNRTITEETFPKWDDDYHQWRNNVYNEARNISENLAQWLKVLDQCTQGPVVEYINHAHAERLLTMSEMLYRLQTFLERDLKWPKMGA